MKIRFNTLPVVAQLPTLHSLPIGSVFRHPGGCDLYIKTDKASKFGIWCTSLNTGFIYQYYETKKVVGIQAGLWARDETIEHSRPTTAFGNPPQSQRGEWPFPDADGIETQR